MSLQPIAHNTRSRSTAVNMESIKFEQFSPLTTTDAGLWLRNFERYCKLRGWNEDQTTAAFPLYLKDSAVMWYDAVPEAIQKKYADLKKTFMDRFMPTSINSWKESGVFLNTKQGPNQSVEEFCEEVHRLAVPLKKGEQDIKDVIIRGLLPHIRQFVLTKDHSTLTEVVQSARMAQSIGGPSTGTVTRLEEKIASLELKLEKQITHLCAMTDAHQQLQQASSTPHQHHHRWTSPHARETRTRSQSPYTREQPREQTRSPSPYSTHHHRTTTHAQPRTHNHSQAPLQSGHYNSRNVRFNLPPSPSDSRYMFSTGDKQRNDFTRNTPRSHTQHTPHQQSNCNQCGKYRHRFRNQCKAIGKQCNFCGKFNHFSRVCLSTKSNSH